MMNLHTCTTSGMDLVLASIAFLHREPVELGGEVVGGARVGLPPWFDGVGRRVSALVSSSTVADMATALVALATMDGN